MPEDKGQVVRITDNCEVLEAWDLETWGTGTVPDGGIWITLGGWAGFDKPIRGSVFVHKALECLEGRGQGATGGGRKGDKDHSFQEAVTILSYLETKSIIQMWCLEAGGGGGGSCPEESSSIWGKTCFGRRMVFLASMEHIGSPTYYGGSDLQVFWLYSTCVVMIFFHVHFSVR